MTTGIGHPLGPAPAVDPATRVIRNLAAAAGWMRFMEVLGFIGAGFSAMAGLFMLVAGLPSSGPFGHAVGLVYVAIAALYLIPLIPLHHAADAAGRLKTTPSTDLAADALHHQAAFWRNLGILSIVGVCLTLFFFAVALFIGLAGRAM